MLRLNTMPIIAPFQITERWFGQNTEKYILLWMSFLSQLIHGVYPNPHEGKEEGTAIESGEVVGSAFLGSVDQLAQLPTQRDAHAALALAVEQEVAVVQAVLKQVPRHLYVLPAIRLDQVHAAFFEPL